jgi:hypothetical protein
MFLLDRNAIERIRHDFQIRLYSRTFQWLEKFRETTATNGFASGCVGQERAFLETEMFHRANEDAL